MLILETLTEPVSLGCHYNFYHRCLREHRDKQENKTCPVCRRMSSKGLKINFALKKLSDSLRHELQPPTSAVEPQTTAVEQPGPAPKQQTEEETEERMEGDPESQLEALRQQRLQYEIKQGIFAGIVQHSEVQIAHCERHIRTVFSELHSFLEEEQQKALSALREEQRRQSQTLGPELQKVREKLRSVNKNIQELKRQLQTSAHSSQQQQGTPKLKTTSQQTKTPELKRRLQTCAQQEQEEPSKLKTTSSQTDSKGLLPQGPAPKRLKLEQPPSPETFLPQDPSPQDVLCRVKPKAAQPPRPQSVPQIPSGLLLDQAKVLGNLGFRVWRNMRTVVQHRHLILDPNTAKPSLHLSEDLSGVTHGEPRENVAYNPERFIKTATVLGSEGFSSGLHQWDMEVGDHPEWRIGVTKESIDRRGTTYPVPDDGTWCLSHKRGRYTNGCSTPVKVQKPPERIRVRLDCDRGTLSFYDADHMDHLYTHTGHFTQKLFPYFHIGRAGDAKTKEIRVCLSEGPL